jgi:hypothetical protein
MRLIRLLFWSLVASVIAPLLADAAPVSEADARRLSREVQENGARNSVLRLHRDGREWNQVMERIATGQREWIDLAVSLKPGSDVAQGRELQYAMFRALGRNPSYVLDRAQPAYPLAVLCLGRAGSSLSYREAIAELEDARKAVQAVRRKGLLAKREFCLATIEEGRVNLQRLGD